MSQSVNQKEFLIVSLINTSTSAVLAFALISYFINKKYKGFAVSLITLSVMIDILTRFFTKQDHKIKITAKFSSIIGTLFLLLFYSLNQFKNVQFQ